VCLYLETGFGFPSHLTRLHLAFPHQVFRSAEITEQQIIAINAWITNPFSDDPPPHDLGVTISTAFTNLCGKYPPGADT
jgi:hypothetical protein